MLHSYSSHLGVWDGDAVVWCAERSLACVIYGPRRSFNGRVSHFFESNPAKI
jgi:hypothetical protein